MDRRSRLFDLPSSARPPHRAGAPADDAAFDGADVADDVDQLGEDGAGADPWPDRLGLRGRRIAAAPQPLEAQRDGMISRPKSV